jgi:hypothetical protein
MNKRIINASLCAVFVVLLVAMPARNDLAHGRVEPG